MLIQNYKQVSIDYRNGCVETMKVYDDFYYDKESLLHCPDCNNIWFYVENKSIHVCPNKEKKTVEINEELIKDKSNEFVCKIGNFKINVLIIRRNFSITRMEIITVVHVLKKRI